MNRRWFAGALAVLVAAGQVVAPTPLCVAEDAPASTDSTSTSSPTEVSTDALWAQLKQHLKAGAYRDALAVLAQLEDATSDDARVAAYRRLCEQRLREVDALIRLTLEGQAELEARLERERREQAAQVARAHVMERQIAREQAQWDAEVKSLKEEAIRRQRANKQLPLTDSGLPGPPRSLQAGAGRTQGRLLLPPA